MTITSTHNQKLKEIRKLQRRRRERDRSGGSSPRARICWPPPTRPAGRRWSASARRQRPARRRGRGGAARRRVRTGLGDADAGGLRGALGGRPDRSALRVPARRRTTRATSARCCARLRPSARPASRSGRKRRSVRPQGGARKHGGDLRRAARAGEPARQSSRARRSRWCPRPAMNSGAWVPDRGTHPPASELTLLVGAERDGLPAERDRRRRRDGSHPDRQRLAQRRDGGDRRAVRGN